VQDCIFCRIVAGEIPSTIVYQDDLVTAFRDIQPQAPIHVLIVPNEHLGSTNDAASQHESALGRLFVAARAIAAAEGVDASGYRLTVNNGADAMQSVDHLHVHLMGGRKFAWPPG
jgi:histidine triad (HIT) family protein